MRHLREDLGYEGVAITDDLGMGALGAWSAYELTDRAIDAGLDLLMWTSAGVAFADLIAHIEDRVEEWPGQRGAHRRKRSTHPADEDRVVPISRGFVERRCWRRIPEVDVLGASLRL